MSDNDNDVREIELSRRNVIGAMGALGAAGALGGAGTAAFFSDQETFTDNELVAGELDLKVDWQETYNGEKVEAFPDDEPNGGDGVRDPIRTRDGIAQQEFGSDFDLLSDAQQSTVEGLFRDQFADVPQDLDAPVIDLRDVKPGDEGSVEFSLHLFDNPGYIQMVGDILENADNTLTEPESMDPQEVDGLESGELLQAVRARIYYGDTGDDAVIASGRLIDVLARLRQGITLDGDRTKKSRQCFENSTTHYVVFEWDLPVDHANEIQTDSAAFDLGFYTEQCRHNVTGPTLEPFEDPLPIPQALTPTEVNGTDQYAISMEEVTQQLHDDLPATTVWGYNGQYPGPSIEAEKDRPVEVEWINKLPTEHILPRDPTIHGTSQEQPDGRSVVHLHGANVPDDVDGWPDAWYTADGQVGNDPDGNPITVDSVNGGHSVTYTYPNTQPATQLWYHDHSLGATRLQVYAGLAGLYTLRSQTEEDLRGTEIPGPDQELPIVIQDRSFDLESGELDYPDGLPVDNPDPNEFQDFPASAEASVVPEFFGNTAVVNGKAWPYLEVEPRKYRFRMLNGSNSRFYNLKLVEWDEKSHTWDLDSEGPGFTVIGSDGGLLEGPAEIEERLLMNPAERADVVIDFSGEAGKDFLLHNDARSPFKDLDQPEDELPLPEIMLFKVRGSEPGSDVTLPSSFTDVTVPDLPTPVTTRNLALVEGEDEFGRLQLLLEDKVWDESVDGLTATVQNETVERWNLVNATEDAHPIHLHYVQFQIEQRRRFDVDAFDPGNPNDITYTEPAQTPPEHEQGWKDTVTALPGQVTSLLVPFGKLTVDSETYFESYEGTYPWHCHILEHEDHEMMRPYEVENPP